MGAELLQTVQPVYNWLVGIMMPWGLVALFVLTFLESLYLIGLLTPGEVTVVAAALVAAGGQSVPLWTVLVAAWLGGIFGVAFGYAVGAWFGIERIRTFMEWCAATRIGRWLKLDPGFIDDICTYFDKHGVMTVFGARFAYGAKSFIPPIAGATNMKFLPFIAASGIGSFAYTLALVVVGWFLQQNVALAGRIMQSIGWFAAFVFVVLFAFAFFALRHFANKRKTEYLDKQGLPHDDPRFLARTFWKKITFFDEVTSTNDVAFESFKAGQKTPAAYIAYRQSAGRGRMARSWVSVDGGVYLSLLLKADDDVQKQASLALVVAVAVARAYRTLLFGVGRADLAKSLSIKWPNDVFLTDKKIAGILLEQKAGALIVGVGLNNRRPSEQDAAEHNIELPTQAIFLDDVDVQLHRKQLALEFLRSFENVYSSWKTSGFIAFLDEYTQSERNMHHKLSVYNHLGDCVDTGYCVGFSEEGALLLGDTPDAPLDEARTVVAGEVSLHGNDSDEVSRHGNDSDAAQLTQKERP